MALSEDPIFTVDKIRQWDSEIDRMIKDIRRIPKPTPKKKKEKTEDEINLENLKNMNFDNLNITDEKLDELKRQFE